MSFSQLFRRLRGAFARASGCVGLVGCFVLTAAPTHAGAPIPGADAPELASAIDRWLENEEEVALSAFAAFARDGNAAARLLLAIIDKTPALQGPWLAHLPRDARIALLRQPGGLSGRSWLHALSDLPHGAAWLALMSTDAGPEVIDAFRELGETRAAREAFVILVARARPALRSLDPARVDPDMLYLFWRVTNDAGREALGKRLARDSLQRAMIEGTFDTERLTEWLNGSIAGEPLDAVCSKLCAETRDDCLSGAYTALASHNALLTLGSPVEALIPQDRFLAHPRGRSSVLRRILQTHDARGRRALIGRMREYDACLADVLEAEAARYRYRRPGTGEGNGD